MFDHIPTEDELRDIAVKYHNHQSLRERLARSVQELWNNKDYHD